ncbi:hypothetical protein CVT26_004194 [Gymnopilus dilepis]|uniref:Uncharacterized protein n=1 Tax=Gymnopilus dilepis TaxID=231916 RepID=A0A409YME7_9AGAR|nr:hypothetical protein CVT26_004194 [Gymnopilus dilepis]
MDRQARYRARIAMIARHREEINRKKREKMREKRAAERRQRTVGDHGVNEQPGRSPWIQSPEDLACAEVLASLRAGASSERTHHASTDSVRMDVEEVVQSEGSYMELDGWKYLAGLRGLVQKWGSVWGGITFWPDAFEEMFLDACKHGQSQAMELAYQVWDHADEGRGLLHEVEKMDGVLPNDSRALKILWTEYSQLQHMLVRAITIIEARMNALDSGIFRLPGAPEDSDVEEEEENISELYSDEEGFGTL